METSHLFGRWILQGSKAFQNDIEIDAPAGAGVSRWLNEFDVTLAANIEAVDGLELEIHADTAFAAGIFTERSTKQLNIPWYDTEGVLCSQVEPFDGYLVANSSGVFLRPNEIPGWATPLDQQYSDALLRLDDGDTQICERIALSNGSLVRIVNVVTDGLYGERIVLVYRKD